MKKIFCNRRERGALERRLLVLCLVLIAGGAILLVKTPQRLAAMDDQRKSDSDFYEFAQLFSEIYSEVRARYVDDVSGKKLFEGAINGMFTALDPHSSWLPPDDQESLERDTEGEYSGVGLHITLDTHKILTVIAPIAGSPASKVGVLPWDRIIEIDGKSTENMQLNDAVKTLTGPDGTSVKIKVAREGVNHALEFTLVRSKVKIDGTFSKIIDGNIGYVRVAKFQEDTADSVHKALDEFNKAKVAGIIVDLRNDPGGLLDQAVGMSNLFLPKKQLIVSLKGRTRGNDREYYAQNDQVAKQPLVVLVNPGSASASEIFSGAMKDTKRGVIIAAKGEHSYGKGSVQTISPLKYSLDKDKNGDYRQSALRLTTAKYYTPSGVSIDGKGIYPDVSFPVPRSNEILLGLHGLLGDPDLIEPGQPLPNIPDLEDLLTTDTTAAAKAPAADDSTTPTVQKIYMPANFRDILLDDAVKYMKGTLLLAESKAKAAA